MAIVIVVIIVLLTTIFFIWSFNHTLSFVGGDNEVPHISHVIIKSWLALLAAVFSFVLFNETGNYGAFLYLIYSIWSLTEAFKSYKKLKEFK